MNLKFIAAIAAAATIPALVYPAQAHLHYWSERRKARKGLPGVQRSTYERMSTEHSLHGTPMADWLVGTAGTRQNPNKYGILQHSLAGRELQEGIDRRCAGKPLTEEEAHHQPVIALGWWIALFDELYIHQKTN